MRFSALVWAFLISFAITPQSNSQQTASVPDPEAVTLLELAANALRGGSSTNNLTLSGSAHRIVGPDDETGFVVFRTTSTSSSMVLDMPSGKRSEVRSTANGLNSGTWSGIDGVNHPISFPNLFTEPFWFVPQQIISRGLAPSGYIPTCVGNEIRSGLAVRHIKIIQNFSTYPGDLFIPVDRFSEINIYIDSITSLPNAIAYRAHPDSDDNVDIPVEIVFTDYRVVNGIRLPFHIQKYLNNSLFLDIQLDAALVN